MRSLPTHSKPSKFIAMKNLTATICLTLTILLGSVGVCASADYQKGFTAYKSGDYATALREWKPLAEQGYASAQYSLGVMYENGHGVPQNHKTALKWYRLAAEQGIALAQFNLGVMYQNGQGVPKDYKTAVKWYRLAAEQGDADAQFSLGLMYGMGRGVIRDPVYAHMWYNIAASNGVKNGANVRNAHATLITPSQLEKAQDLARECVRKKYKGC